MFLNIFERIAFSAWNSNLLKKFDIYNRLENITKSVFVYLTARHYTVHSFFAEKLLFGTYTDLKWVV